MWKDVVTSVSVVHCKMYFVQFKESITAYVTPVGKVCCTKIFDSH